MGVQFTHHLYTHHVLYYNTCYNITREGATPGGHSFVDRVSGDKVD